MALALAACRSPAPPARPDARALAVGIYRAYLPAPDALGRAITLDLRASGEARLTTLFVGRDAPILEAGSWFADASGVRVQLVARADRPAPAPLVWTQRRLRLEPVSWDERVYGSVGVPLVRWLPSRAPRPGCVWRPVTDARLGLRLLAASCAASATPFDVSAAIESLPKPADQPIETALTERLAATVPDLERRLCAVRAAKGVALGDPTKFAFEIAPKRKRAAGEPTCQTWGAQGGAAYFEYHPAESRERVLFVRRTQDFDERSIELLR